MCVRAVYKHVRILDKDKLIQEMGNLKRKEREQGIRQTMTKRQTGGMKKNKIKRKETQKDRGDEGEARALQTACSMCSNNKWGFII